MRYLAIFLCFFFTSNADATIKSSVYLDVPLVSQGRSLCGPAAIEMVWRYWGISEYDQYDIAYHILMFRPDIKRVKKSKILDERPIDWSRYPGTGTSTMRDFLGQFSTTRNHKFKHLSADPSQSEKEKLKVWGLLKKHLSDRTPVIVHQYWKGKGSRGHYRVVTGYNDSIRRVYLNDPSRGKAIVQTYAKFFELWNVDKPWLHYNMIVFNANRSELNIKLKKAELPRPYR